VTTKRKVSLALFVCFLTEEAIFPTTAQQAFSTQHTSQWLFPGLKYTIRRYHFIGKPTTILESKKQLSLNKQFESPNKLEKQPRRIGEKLNKSRPRKYHLLCSHLQPLVELS
jgi:hypothetical protein